MQLQCLPTHLSLGQRSLAYRTSIFEIFLFGFVSFSSSKFELVPGVVCFCVCSVESGGVDNYIGRRGDNSI